MSPRLSESLKRETRELHRRAERTAFIRSLMRGEMDRHRYCAMLRNLHAIYAALEPALKRHADDPRLAPLYFPALWREAALRQDLEVLHGAGWEQALPLQPAAARYVERLRLIGDGNPELLAAHSYVRYLGDLSGGQMMGRVVRESLALQAGAGTAFYAFGDAAEAQRLKQAYRDGLDALPTDQAAVRAIVAEARLAFELHQQLFEQLAPGQPLDRA